jgi:hypothetical protein
MMPWLPEISGSWKGGICGILGGFDEILLEFLIRVAVLRLENF